MSTAVDAMSLAGRRGTSAELAGPGRSILAERVGA
jgi:hypothetical protein